MAAKRQRSKRTNMRFNLVTLAGIKRIREIYNIKTDTEAVALAVYYLSVIPKVDWLVENAKSKQTQPEEPPEDDESNND